MRGKTHFWFDCEACLSAISWWNFEAGDTKDIEWTASSEEGGDEGASRLSGLVCWLEHFPIRSQSAEQARKWNRVRTLLPSVTLPFSPSVFSFQNKSSKTRRGAFFRCHSKKESELKTVFCCTMYLFTLLIKLEHTVGGCWECCKEDPVEGSHILWEVILFKLVGETWERLTTVLRAWRKWLVQPEGLDHIDLISHTFNVR